MGVKVRGVVVRCGSVLRAGQCLKKIIATCSLFVLGGVSGDTISLMDVRNTLEEMLSYHVEYKDVTPQIVRRSFKLFIEQFDPTKIYLLQGEVAPFLDLSPEDVESSIESYCADVYPDYERAAKVIEGGILRAQRIRKEVIKKLIDSGDEVNLSFEKPIQFARDEGDLQARIHAQMVRYLSLEKQAKEQWPWNRERRDKILSFYDRKFRQFEAKYILTAPKGEHYFAVHLLKAFSRSLDAHTAYYTAQEASEMRAVLEKQFEGVGVVFRDGVDGVEIISLISGGAAEKSGKIFPGDILVGVNEKRVEEVSYDEVLSLLSKIGSRDVVFTVRRFVEDGDVLEERVALRKEKLVMENERVSCSLEPCASGVIGKIALHSFYESASSPSSEQDLREALSALRKEGNLQGVVLDLRENLGGFLSQAVKVSSLFMSSGVVVVSKYAQGEVQYLRNIDPRLPYSGPLVILTSKSSASAAEIVAQALQDYGVALVVGDARTYGKGTIQYQTITDDRSGTFFKVTVGRYYTVSGRSTQITGVLADIEVPTAFSSYNIGERYLEYALQNDQMPPVYQDSLADLDGKSKLWFQNNYLPHLQRKETKWTRMLTTLKNNSSYRIEHDPNFSAFLAALKNPQEPSDYGEEDLPMVEAVNIVKDMVALCQK